MNIVLLDPRQTESDLWSITSKRQLEHLQQHLEVQVGDTLKVGIREGKRYLTEVVEISEKAVLLKPIQEEGVPAKLPVTLIVALPRPKVLRRLIMDAVTMGVEKIILLHSYRVDKAIGGPILQQLNHYIDLRLEQAGIRFLRKLSCINALNLLSKISCRDSLQQTVQPLLHILMPNSRCHMHFSILARLSLAPKVALFRMKLICS